MNISLKILLATLLVSMIVFNPGSVKSRDKDKEPDIEQQIYAMLKRDGGFSGSEFPFMVYFKKIEKTKLNSVEFLRYDESGKKFDLIGRADAVELRVDMARKRILVDASSIEAKHSDGTTIWVERRAFEFELPADCRFLKAKSAKLPKREDLPLSSEDRKFLAEGLPREIEPSLVHRKLSQAFGPDCKELGRPLRSYLHDFNIVISAGEIVKERDGSVRYASCSIAQFSRNATRPGDVQLSIRSDSVRCNFYLLNGAPSEVRTLHFECADGTRISVKKID